jgi:hypothetical protein
MDEEIGRIIRSTFTVQDSQVVERMLTVVEKDINGTNKRRRLMELDAIIGDKV